LDKHQFFERFTIDFEYGRLGGGAFGTVYKAYDNLSDSWKAIKIAEVKYIDGKQFSLASEYGATKHLSIHKNIANYESVHEFRMSNGMFAYAIMQYYPEGNLKELLSTHEINQAERIAIVEGLLAGIEYLHLNKIIHRDLKPSNILISKDIKGSFIPKIADFGLSKIADENELTSISNSFAGGTLEYSPPEQLYGHKLSFNSDLWSFGVIAFEILTGKKPFTSDDFTGSAEAKRSVIYHKIINAEIPATMDLCPTPFDQVIRRCLVKDNKLRALSAAELWLLIRAGAQEKPVQKPSFYEEETVIYSTYLINKEKEQAEQQRIEQDSLAEVKRKQAEQQRIEQERLEQERLAEEHRLAEAEKQRQEQAAKEEAARQKALAVAEAERLAEIQRKKEEAERDRLELERLEQERLAEERSKSEAEKQRQEQAAQVEAERQKALAIAESQRLAEEQRIKEVAERHRLEQERLAEEHRQAEAEKQRQEQAAHAEAERQKALAIAEAQHLAEEKRKQGEAERHLLEQEQLAEDRRQAEAERQRQKQAAQAEAERQKALALVISQRLAEEQRKQEEAKRLRLEQERLAEERKKVEAEKQRKEKAAQVEAERQKAIAIAEAQRLAEKQRKEEKKERQRLEKQRLAEERKGSPIDSKRKKRWLMLGMICLASIFLMYYTYTSYTYTHISYQEKGKYGIRDVDGGNLLPAIYDSIYLESWGHIVAYKDGIEYRFDKNGKLTEKIEPMPQNAPNDPVLTLNDQASIDKATIEQLLDIIRLQPNHPLIVQLKKQVKVIELKVENDTYQKIKNSKDINVLEGFLIRYPKSVHSMKVKSDLQSLIQILSQQSENVLYQTAIQQNSIALLGKYLEKYPKGKYVKEVQNALLDISKTIETTQWTDAVKYNTIDAYQAFILKYPASKYLKQAKNNISSLQSQQAWFKIKNTNDEKAIRDFLKANPNSVFSSEAIAILNAMEAGKKKNTSTEMPKKEIPNPTPPTKDEDDKLCLSIVEKINQNYVKIPAGKFVNSISEDVSISSFSLSKYEFSQAQYMALMGQDANLAYFHKDENQPLESINYYQIKQMLVKLNSQPCSEYTYRLPTLDEWEYAASAGSPDALYAGSNDAAEVAVYFTGKPGTRTTGTKKANAFGLYDMTGNVAEICLYNSQIMRKGGSWREKPGAMKIKNTIPMPAGSADNQTGFRLVREKK
jgi:serine/threonine protein kinase